MIEIIFSVVLSVFLPVVMISCGYWFVTNPPDNINGIVGYRSKRSMINGSTWAYAHKVSGIHWLICGAIGLLCPIALAVLGFTGTIYGNGCLLWTACRRSLSADIAAVRYACYRA
ncbi:MAG: SdpI family protein [Ruminococcus sp.]|nr:MAG: SdpI family protein [Ruminococcus sp.]